MPRLPGAPTRERLGPHQLAEVLCSVRRGVDVRVQVLRTLAEAAADRIQVRRAGRHAEGGVHCGVGPRAGIHSPRPAASSCAAADERRSSDPRSSQPALNEEQVHEKKCHGLRGEEGGHSCACQLVAVAALGSVAEHGDLLDARRAFVSTPHRAACLDTAT
eukprot:scaffold71472_cov50-Phaeocystis_antarctica.AAC.2